MSIIHAHPAWCSTSHCIRWDDTLDHRSQPMAWKSSTDDFWITTGVSQLEEVAPGVPCVSPAAVNLGLLDLAGLDPSGRPRKVETDLTAQDARLLAQALIVAAEQLEALQGKAAA